MTGWQLIAFYRHPERMSESMNGWDWSNLIHAIRDAGLGASFLPVIEKLDFCEKDRVMHHVLSYFTFAEKQYLTIIRELLELESVFAQCNYPVLLVKGVAYRIAQFDYAQFRLFSDIDLLIHPDNFADAIQRLKNQGYIEQTYSDYERNYYINWSHQHPPLRHLMRSAEIDVHHTIFFAHSRVQIDIGSFISRAKSIEASVFSIPTTADMFVHACLHLFYQEENQKLVKDLIDLHCLYNQIDIKDDIIDASSISNKKSAICYGLMVQAWLFQVDLTANEQLFIQNNCKPFEITWIQWLIKSMLQDNSINKRCAAVLWYVRGHLIKMRFPTLIYHTLMKSFHSYMKKRRLGKEQKLLDAQTLPKDAK